MEERMCQLTVVIIDGNQEIKVPDHERLFRTECLERQFEHFRSDGRIFGAVILDQSAGFVDVPSTMWTLARAAEDCACWPNTLRSGAMSRRLKFCSASLCQDGWYEMCSR